jgi:predicted HTH transcriptional regulator
VWAGSAHEFVAKEREYGRISNRKYRELCDVSNYTAALDLQGLVEKQLLVAEGRGRYYRLAMQT